jgi:pimeloyl-ACP methyl ester carboxylesterase
VITRRIEVDGVTLQIREAGVGPALVLLHGLAASSANWSYTMPALATRWRVIAPDLPGHGRSEKPDAPYTLAYHAAIVRALCRRLDVGEAVLAGNALGAQVALEVARTDPASVRALALIAPAGAWGPLSGRLPAWLVGAAARPAVLRATLGRSLERAFFDATQPGLALRRALLAEALSADDAPAFLRAVSRSLAGSFRGGEAPPAAPAAPTLLVWGRDDRILPLRGSDAFLRALPRAHLAVIERCGHVPMLERPEDFNRVLSTFLNRLEDS